MRERITTNDVMRYIEQEGQFINIRKTENITEIERQEKISVQFMRAGRQHCLLKLVRELRIFLV